MPTRKWILVALTSLLLIAVIIWIPRSKTPSSSLGQSSYQYSSSKQSANQQEQHNKQRIMSVDIASTDKLTRAAAKQQLLKLLEELQGTEPSSMKKRMSQLHKKYSNIAVLHWVEDGNHIKHTSTAPRLNWTSNQQKTINSYVQIAKKRMTKQHSYQSASFKLGEEQYFVAAVPSTEHKNGIITVMSQHVLKDVENHQKKNLRMIPYPKEGKYKVESIHADTLKDITVKTGHDNEKASHFYENEIVVHFRQEITDRDLKKINNDLRAKSVRKLGYAYVFRADDMNYQELNNYFTQQWDVVYTEPHYLYLTNEINDENTTSAVPDIPNDVLFTDYQWNLPAIQTNKAWKLSRGSDDVIVAVIDTGVDLEHSDLQGQLLKGYNVIDPEQDPIDDVGHGTHVAGIIGALVNNSEGVAGVSWYNKILPIKVLDKTGSGTTYSVAEGIIWATDHGAKVINMSLGNYADSEFLHDAIRYAYDRDVVLVAATGNDATERPGYPAAYPEVFAVSATDAQNKLASFSNYGEYIDVTAPGASIASTYPGNQYAALSGTSMASPHVAAMAGLIRSRNPELNNEEVMDLIRSSTVDLGESGRDKYFGYGQVDIYKALELAGNGEAPLQFWPQHVEQDLQRYIDGKTAK